jgi:hypothetical protein
MGGKQDNSAASATVPANTGNPIIDNLFGQIRDKQAAAAAPQQTGVQKFGDSLSQFGNNLMARSSGHGQQQDSLQSGLTQLGNSMINRFGPHNNVARPVDTGGAPNLFQGYQPQMPSFGGQTAEGGGIGTGPVNFMRRRMPVPVQAPAQPLPMANITPQVAGATPSLFGK